MCILIKLLRITPNVFFSKNRQFAAGVGSKKRYFFSRFLEEFSVFFTSMFCPQDTDDFLYLASHLVFTCSFRFWISICVFFVFLKRSCLAFVSLLGLLVFPLLASRRKDIYALSWIIFRFILCSHSGCLRTLFFFSISNLNTAFLSCRISS